MGLLVGSEEHNLKSEMNGFSKEKGAYVMAMVGQAVLWQINRVGIVGLVFSVSSQLSNVINVSLIEVSRHNNFFFMLQIHGGEVDSILVITEKYELQRTNISARDRDL
ncbi:hypothetical protein Bca52824_016246 [Brassica carinata]|uniref:Uncharacterized protein n=1 Tax=Brassica carinata TaxID=52824 RepID=A0A8X8B669_BRACI|nr:hypothetical protein Bca52824_016246 [Brassica carinata]